MKTKKMYVDSRGGGMEEALCTTEKLGAESGLERKPLLHLRLLAEELFGMLRSIAGMVEAEYRVEYEGRNFSLRLRSDLKMTGEMRQQFLSASTSGENAAAKGIMGKIRIMIAEFMADDSSESALLDGLSLGLMNMASPSASDVGAGAFFWSMDKYRDEVKKKKNDGEDAAEAWDELEKSIVANIADDVSVRILGPRVEIIVSKAF